MLVLVESSNKDPDIWFRVLNKLNDFLCEQYLSKSDIIEFLKALNHFQPKVLEKSNNLDRGLKEDSTNLFTKEHEEEYLRLRTPGDFFTQFTLFLKKHLKTQVIKHVLDEAVKMPNAKEATENWDDLLGVYDILFENFEKKVIDDIKNGRADYTHSDCIKLIQCFSRAETGTNLLYEVLMRKVAKFTDQLTIEEIEILLNYLPHDLYNEDGFTVNESFEDKVGDKYVENGKTFEIDVFYKQIFAILSYEIVNANDDLFINLWQGILKIKFVNISVINLFLKNFEARIKKAEKEQKFFFDFLQIFAYFIKNKEEYIEILEFQKLYNLLEEHFLKKYINRFSLKEIATIFWIFYHFKIVDKKVIDLFNPSIKNILLSYINDPKAKIESMGYESNLRYYDNYNIERHDLEALNYFIKNSNYSGDLLNIMNKALKSIELENTHPISRKWFFF